MFTLVRLARRIAENPKLLIAFGVLIVMGLLVDYVLLGGLCEPLPDPDDVQSVSFVRGSAGQGSQPQPVDMGLYRELRQCLEGAERLISSGTGELTGTIVIRQTDGSTCRAELYEWGLVRTKDGLYSFGPGDSKHINRLSGVIRKIGSQTSYAVAWQGRR